MNNVCDVSELQTACLIKGTYEWRLIPIVAVIFNVIFE